MAETIEGGAAFDTATGRWIDAEGRPLSKQQIADAEKMAEERAAMLKQAEKDARMLDAQRDPTARAIAAALSPESAPAAAARTVPRDAKS